jgi:uncharacterized cupredoxin-like copper-binding protein
MLRIVMLVAALAVVAAACGTQTDHDGDHSSETAAAAASTTTAAPTTTIAATTTVAPATESTGGDPAEPDESAATTDGITTSADRVVEIVMTDFAFDADPLRVAPGETIEFVVVNAGVVLHEFRLSNAHRIEEHLNDDHDDHDDNADTTEADGHHENGDVVLTLEAGETGTMTVTFPEDTDLFTEVACLIPGHYEAGMHSGIAYSA